MREILFRGKRSKQSDFIYGSLHVHPESGACAIFCKDRGVPWYCYNEVLPETVGQYTGLTDKNGKKIFEGEICSFDNGEATSLYAVAWACNRWAVQMIGYSALPDDLDGWFCARAEVCGNIHDNPELMEGENV